MSGSLSVKRALGPLIAEVRVCRAGGACAPAAYPGAGASAATSTRTATMALSRSRSRIGVRGKSSSAPSRKKTLFHKTFEKLDKQPYFVPK